MTVAIKVGRRYLYRPTHPKAKPYVVIAIEEVHGRPSWFKFEREDAPGGVPLLLTDKRLEDLCGTTDQTTTT